jgi:hypothetical protein
MAGHRAFGRGYARPTERAEIRPGRPAPPFAAERPADFVYYFATPRANLDLPEVVYFRDRLRRRGRRARS